MTDTAEKRRAAAHAGVPILGPGVTPNASPDKEWRYQAGYSYFFETENIIVDANLESISISTFQATVQADIDTNIDAALESITLTEHQATVQVGANIDIDAALESVQVTPLGATIQRDINAQVESISLVPFGATVQADVDTNISAALDLNFCPPFFAGRLIASRAASRLRRCI